MFLGKKMRLVTLLPALMLMGCSMFMTAEERQKAIEADVSARLQLQLDDWLGTPYIYGGTTERGIDCSAFTQVTFNDQFKVDLPRTTIQQIKLGERVERKDLKAGDLIFFYTASGTTGLHVGIYQGNNQFIHSSGSKGVIRSTLKNPYWNRVYLQSRRIPLQNEPEETGVLASMSRLLSRDS